MVVDFAMPELRGDDFAAEARQLRNAVPIIFVTGYVEASAIHAENWVLEKPFRAASLIRMVAEAPVVPNVKMRRAAPSKVARTRMTLNSPDPVFAAPLLNQLTMLNGSPKIHL